MQRSETLIPHALRNHSFASALLDPDAQIPEGVGKEGVISPKRFSVYRNNVVVSLMEAVKAAYPSIAAIMGEENFNLVARNFVAFHPPKSPLMQQYGGDFPNFLKNFKPLQKSPFLVDVAEAEKAWLQAFHAKDEAVLSPEDLAQITPEETMNLKFEVHSAGHLIESAFPVHDLFLARFEWPAPNIDLEQSQGILISRPELDCISTSLTQSQSVFFRSLFSGETLAAAIGSGMEIEEAFDASVAISIMLQTGIFKKPN